MTDQHARTTTRSTKARCASLLGLAIGWATICGAAPTSELRIDVDGLRNAKGLIQMCVTSDPARFPACVDDAHAVTRVVPATAKGVVIGGLPHGGYAVSVIHDENANRRLDTFAGIPREGFGFSRNPAIRFGPPRFDDARFAFGADAPEQHVRVKYLL